MPKISIIIPVYNTESTIRRCLKSVLNQTFQDFEIICVDDKGKDNAIKIVEEFESLDSRVKILRHRKNSGPMLARKTGYENAEGDYFMFLDSDDTLPSDSLESLYNIARDKNTDIVIGGYTRVWEDVNKKQELIPEIDVIKDKTDTFKYLLNGTITHNLAFAMFKSTLFEREYYTIEKQTNGEDLILFYQLVGHANGIAICHKSIYNYYQNPNSSSHSKLNENLLRQYVNIQNFKYQYLLKQGIDKEPILKNIIPKIVDWYHSPVAEGYARLLDIDIRLALQLSNIIKYTSFRTVLKFIYLKMIK